MTLTAADIPRKERMNLAQIEKELLFRHCYKGEELENIMIKLNEIENLRNEKDAVILAHYYQIPPIQLIADARGDSLNLALEATKIKDKKLIVSSTVVFMAETTKLLNPDKKVVVPSLEAGCSIAEGINAETVRVIRNKFPSANLIGYINTYAATKAELDVVCTSANAVNIVRNSKSNQVVMLPDYFFARNIAKQAKQSGIDKEILAYKEKKGNSIIVENLSNGLEYTINMEKNLPARDRGTCIVHEQFTSQEIRDLRKKYGIEIVMAHPEVSEDVANASDMIGGTGKMLSYVKDNPQIKSYLVITECDLTAPLREENPDKEFYTPCKICPYMKRNDLDSLIRSLREEIYEINIDPLIGERARKSILKMFELDRRNSKNERN